jgi:acetate kinase
VTWHEGVGGDKIGRHGTEVRYSHQPWAVMEAKVMQSMGTIACHLVVLGLQACLCVYQLK